MIPWWHTFDLPSNLKAVHHAALASLRCPTISGAELTGKSLSQAAMHDPASEGTRAPDLLVRHEFVLSDESCTS